jgi:SAM-dependent methyltransferase
MLKWVETIGKKYLKLFAVIEGPELEPTIFHSHYLSVRAIHVARRQTRTLLHGDVLDVGAGTGLGRQLVADDANYFPTDIDSARDYQDTALTREGIPLAKQCSVYDIDYPENRFDACMALSLFEHLLHPDRALTEIKRVVKPNGLIVLLVPFNFPVHGYPDDYWRWTVPGLKQFMQGHGVQVTACFPCGNAIHSLSLNLNLFLREGMLLKGHAPSTPRLAVFAVVRPLLTLLFFTINILATVFGALDKSATSPILVCAIARNTKP